VLGTVELQPHMQLQLPGYDFTNISRMLLLRPFSRLEYHSVQAGLMMHVLYNLIVGPWKLELESDEEVEFVDEAEIEPAMDV